MFRQAIAQTRWSEWQISPLAGDASTRRYARIHGPHKQTAILMLDPPQGTNGTVQFAHISDVLLKNRLTAPDVLFHDPAHGIMIISDLGKTTVAAHLHNHPNEEQHIYDAALEVLLQLHAIIPPENLTKLDAKTSAAAVDVAAVHYARKQHATHDLITAVEQAMTANVAPRLSLALRDFHAENLMWRPLYSGVDRLGILDFQDACLAPAGYDLMSLIRDARRDVDPAVAANLMATFRKTAPTATSAHLATIAVQRNLRILGVFARLAQAGRTGYLHLIPRVWTHLINDISHPDLHQLKTVVLDILPPPDKVNLP